MEDGIGKAVITLPGGAQIEALLDADTETPAQADMDAVFENVRAFLAYFQPALQAKLQARIAKEITDAAYEQLPEFSTEAAYKKLQDDLSVAGGNFFADAVVLIYRSPSIFAENDIVVQLMDDFTVDEIYVDA